MMRHSLTLSKTQSMMSSVFLRLTEAYRVVAIRDANAGCEENPVVDALNTYLEHLTEPNFIAYAQCPDFGTTPIRLVYEYVAHDIEIKHSYDHDRIITTHLDTWVNVDECQDWDTEYYPDPESMAVVYDGYDNGVLRDILGNLKAQLFRHTPMWKE